jgi:DNA gyrase/topoisomerase IV subunit A
MKTTDYKLSEVANNEWREFAMYTIESRAIPSMIDGLKPSQRFYLYSSLVNSSKEFKKVSAIAGIVSDYGYNHGEQSVASTGQLMAADWNNNLCLVEGRGSFGTRLIQESGAPRYVYTRVHSNFNKYIRDVNLSPEHPDPEHMPPQYYIPVIPLVLVNGVKGVAVAFATNILPRKVDDVKKACSEYLKSGKIKSKLPISFPQFNGTVDYDIDTDKYSCKGVFTRQGKSKITITDIPYGYDRETYVKILDNLEDTGEIVSYEDKCSSKGFEFEIKLKQQNSDWDNDKIIKEFKLSKSYTENITVINHDGKLKEYTDERELIKDFCDFRLDVLKTRIEKNILKFTEESRWLTVKMQFIMGVLNNKIVFKNNKKDVVIGQIEKNTSAIQDDHDRLLRLNMLSLTLEQVEQLKKQIEECQDQIKFWTSTTPKDQFISDLSEI